MRGKIEIIGEIYAVIASFCWALGASLYKEAIHDTNPIKFNLIRSVSAAIFSFIILFILGKTDSLFQLDPYTIIIMAIS